MSMGVRFTPRQAEWFLAEGREDHRLAAIIRFLTQDAEESDPDRPEYVIQQEVAQRIVEVERERLGPFEEEHCNASETVRYLWDRIQTGTWETPAEVDPLALSGLAAQEIWTSGVPADARGAIDEISFLPGHDPIIFDDRERS